jgi:hypothetical protein
MPNQTRRGRNNTFSPPRITYAKIQLTQPRRPAFPKIAPLWNQFRFIDITPKIDGKTVGSLNRKKVMGPGGVLNKDGTIASIAEAFLKEMAKTTPDWFFISGHHARLYSSDEDGYRRITQAEVARLPRDSYDKLLVKDQGEEEYRKLTAQERRLLPNNLQKDLYVSEKAAKYSGFFNDHYHHARWAVATRSRFKRDDIMLPLRERRRKMKPTDKTRRRVSEPMTQIREELRYRS